MNNIYDLEKFLYNNILEDATLIIHGLSKSKDFYFVAKKILKEGISIRGEGGLNYCCTILENCKLNDLSRVYNYRYAKDENNLACTILIAIPRIIKDLEDNIYYIGPFEDLYVGRNDNRIKHVLRHPFNAYINQLRNIPKEFIVGAYIKDYYSEKFKEFIVNPSYINLMTKKEQIMYFQTIRDQLIKCGLKCVNDDFLIFDKESFYGKNLLEYVNNTNLKINRK